MIATIIIASSWPTRSSAEDRAPLAVASNQDRPWPGKGQDASIQLVSMPALKVPACRRLNVFIFHNGIESGMKYIFEVTINPGWQIEDYVEIWIAESEIIQRQPGARGTKLHRAINQPDKLLAIAGWESKAARDAALERLRHDPRIVALRESRDSMVAFRLIGEFEDPAWIVSGD